MRIEELRLVLSTVGALGVPPAGSIAVKSGTSAIDSDVVTGDRNEGTLPLLVAESGGALEHNVGTLLKVGQVKGSAGRDGNVVESDGRARLLVLDRISGTAGTAEGAAGTLIKGRRCGDDRCGSQCHCGEGSEELHVKE